jgi:hypothetical protein
MTEEDAGNQLVVTVIMLCLVLALVVAIANLIGAINVFG